MREGWEKKKLGEISSVEYGFTSKSVLDGTLRYIRITDIDKEGNLLLTDKKYIDDNEYARKYQLKENDILMARTGATFGKVLLYKDYESSVFASYLIRINFEINMINKLYWYFSHSSSYWNQANNLSSGSAQPHFNGKALKEVIFSYPTSLEEQKQIVNTLDLAFKQIDQAKANLEKNLANTKELFASKLNEVFSQRGEGWVEKKLGDVCENLDNQRIPITKNKREEGNIPYYGASGIVDYVKDYIFDEDLLLVSEDGANLLARTYPIAFSISGKNWVNNHAHVLKFESMISQKFVEYYLNSIKLDAYVSGMAQPKLNQRMLNSISVPYPNIEIQKSILGNINHLDISIQKLQTHYQQNLNNLEELKKSILEKAFKGEL